MGENEINIFLLSVRDVNNVTTLKVLVFTVTCPCKASSVCDGFEQNRNWRKCSTEVFGLWPQKLDCNEQKHDSAEIKFGFCCTLIFATVRVNDWL